MNTKHSIIQLIILSAALLLNPAQAFAHHSPYKAETHKHIKKIKKQHHFNKHRIYKHRRYEYVRHYRPARYYRRYPKVIYRYDDYYYEPRITFGFNNDHIGFIYRD